MSVFSTSSYGDEYYGRRSGHNRRKCCSAVAICTAFFLIVVVILIILVILAFTAFKPKEPTIHVEDVKLERFNVNLQRTGLLSISVSANITLAIVISVHNPNRASFQYTDSESQVYYHSQQVAMVPIPSGKIGSQDSENISTSLDLYADKLLTNTHLINDYFSGSLPFETSTKLSGRVKVLGFIRHHVDISAQCNITIAVNSTSIQNVDCQNTVNL